MTIRGDDRGGVSTDFFFKKQLVSLRIEYRDPLEVESITVVKIAKVTSACEV
jgi:hypothetical protein